MSWAPRASLRRIRCTRCVAPYKKGLFVLGTGLSATVGSRWKAGCRAWWGQTQGASDTPSPPSASPHHNAALTRPSLQSRTAAAHELMIASCLPDAAGASR